MSEGSNERLYCSSASTKPMQDSNVRFKQILSSHIRWRPQIRKDKNVSVQTNSSSWEVQPNELSNYCIDKGYLPIFVTLLCESWWTVGRKRSYLRRASVQLSRFWMAEVNCACGVAKYCGWYNSPGHLKMVCRFAIRQNYWNFKFIHWSTQVIQVVDQLRLSLRSKTL